MTFIQATQQRQLLSNYQKGCPHSPRVFSYIFVIFLDPLYFLEFGRIFGFHDRFRNFRFKNLIRCSSSLKNLLLSDDFRDRAEMNSKGQPQFGGNCLKRKANPSIGFNSYPQMDLLKIGKLFYGHTTALSQMTHFVRNTSEHEHFELARSTASHDNHINALFPGEFHNLFRRMAFKQS